MNPARMLVAVSYGLVFAALLPVALSGEVGIAAPIAFLVAMVASLLRDPHASPPRPLTARLWTLGLFAALAGLVAWSASDGNWLLHALEFALLMVVSRFFQRRFSKDYLQLVGLAFILLLVAAIVNPGPAFAVCFLVFAVMTMWGLTLLHLVRELEIQTRTGPEHLLAVAAPHRKWWRRVSKAAPEAVRQDWAEVPISPSVLQWRSRRLIGLRFLAASSALALGVLAISALFFFLFPRLGMGFFFAQTRGAQTVIGFGTDAELGNFGALKTSAEVVMRVRFPDQPARLEHPVRLRGISFDRFEGNRWTRKPETAWELQLEMGRYRVSSNPPPEPGVEREWRAEIYLEPLSHDPTVLFVPPRTHAVEILDGRFDAMRGRRRRVRQASSGDLTYKAPNDTALHYAVDVVDVPAHDAQAARLRAANDPLPRQIAKRWAGLPADLDPRVAKLARRLAGNARSRYDQARAIEQGLREGWLYSLAGDQDPEKPLEDFLFRNRRGHCEYFSTAMALLMRTLGHAARPVHGFAGGAYNPYGGYRMVRQADAHAWVEVFFPGVGWATFDPTPAAGQLAPTDDGVAAQVRQLLDGAELLWYQWIVEYDLERQVELFRAITRALSSLRKPSNLAGFGSQPEPTEPPPPADPTTEPTRWWLWLGAAGIVAVGGALVVRRRTRRRSSFDPAIDRAAGQLQRLLERRGLGRRPNETWAALASRLASADPEAGEHLGRFSHAYDRARFGRDPSVAERRTALEFARAAIAWARGTRRRPQSPV